MSDWRSMFEPDGRGFLSYEGAAKKRGDKLCQKKLCFVSTDLDAIGEILLELIGRPDCYYAKVDAERGRHGMYRGRLFLTDPVAVGNLWKKYRVSERLLCMVQDDDFTIDYR